MIIMTSIIITQLLIHIFYCTYCYKKDILPFYGTPIKEYFMTELIYVIIPFAYAYRCILNTYFIDSEKYIYALTPIILFFLFDHFLMNLYLIYFITHIIKYFTRNPNKFYEFSLWYIFPLLLEFDIINRHVKNYIDCPYYRKNRTLFNPFSHKPSKFFPLK
jgi:hypothetical protein